MINKKITEIWKDLGMHMFGDRPTLEKYKKGDDLQQYRVYLFNVLSHFAENAELAEIEVVKSFKADAQKILAPIEAATGKKLNTEFKVDLVEFEKGETLRYYENRLNAQVAKIQKGVPTFFRNHLLHAGKGDGRMQKILMDLQHSIAHEPSHSKISKKLQETLSVADHPEFKQPNFRAPLRASQMPNFHESMAIPKIQPRGQPVRPA